MVFEYDQNFIFLNINDALSIFDKDEKEQNLEIYLSDPLLADKYKEEIIKINQKLFCLFMVRSK